MIKQINDNLDSVYIDKLNKVITEEQSKRIGKYINDFLSMKNLSRELIVNFIDRIDVYEDKRIR